MLKSKNILFFIAVFTGLTLVTSENLHSWYSSFDNQTVLLENNEDTQDENNTEENIVFITPELLSIHFELPCSKIDNQKSPIVIRQTYPIWLPPKIS